MINYTAKYTKIDAGYMGQLIERPEIVTEGSDLEECRKMLRDALNETVLAYQQLEREIPAGNALIEQLPVEDERVYISDILSSSAAFHKFFNEKFISKS